MRKFIFEATVEGTDEDGNREIVGSIIGNLETEEEEIDMIEIEEQLLLGYREEHNIYFGELQLTFTKFLEIQ